MMNELTNLATIGVFCANNSQRLLHTLIANTRDKLTYGNSTSLDCL